MFRKLFGWLGRSYIARACHHKTKLSGQMKAFDECRTGRMPLNENGTTEWCFECLGKMAIRCAWCKNPIFIGDPITLYTPIKLDFQLPADAVIYKQNPLQVVGCLGWDCASSGMDRMGFWVPGKDGKGCIDRVASPIELLMATGSPVVVGDLGDMKEAHGVQAVAITNLRA